MPLYVWEYIIARYKIIDDEFQGFFFNFKGFCPPVYYHSEGFKACCESQPKLRI